MLRIERLTVHRGRTEVLCGVSLAVAAGRVHGLVGRNGAGKTTLLDAVFGLVRPTAGEVCFGDRPIRAADVAYMPADTYFYPRITGREYLGIFAARNPAFDVAAWSDVFDVPLDQFVDDCSSGTQQKLALLGVLSLDRQVVMLDEPMNGLDMASNEVLMRLLRMLAEAGKTVLVTSHVLETLTATCDEIHVLDGGVIAGSFADTEFAQLRELLTSGQPALKIARLSTLVGRRR